MSARELSVAVVQSGGMTSDIDKNIARLAELICAAAHPTGNGKSPDLVLLPELCTTPYFCISNVRDRTRWAETATGRTFEAFRSLAIDLGCAIAFGLYERTEDDTYYNSVVVVSRDGELVPWKSVDSYSTAAYRKLSLPSVSLGDIDVDEKRFFSPGPRPVVFDLFGTRVGCVICYDRSFPEYWQVARALGAEVMLVVVSSLGAREDLFMTELRTRAVESQTWVVVANRGGPETLGETTATYFGRSAVIDPAGGVITAAEPHTTGSIVHAALDLDLVHKTRTALPFGRDRRSDVLSLLARLTDRTAVPPDRIERELISSRRHQMDRADYGS